MTLPWKFSWTSPVTFPEALEKLRSYGFGQPQVPPPDHKYLPHKVSERVQQVFADAVLLLIPQSSSLHQWYVTRNAESRLRANTNPLLWPILIRDRPRSNLDVVADNAEVLALLLLTVAFVFLVPRVVRLLVRGLAVLVGFLVWIVSAPVSAIAGSSSGSGGTRRSKSGPGRVAGYSHVGEKGCEPGFERRRSRVLSMRELN